MESVVEAKADVKVIETKIAEYSPTAAGLADLQHRFKGVVFDVTTAKGNKEAREARYELVKLRTGLEAKRKEIKAPALERSRLIDSEASRIAAAIAELEHPIDDQIRREDERKEAEKQAKIEAEARRVADIRERIQQIGAVAMRAVGQKPAGIEEKIRLVVGITIGADYAEFAEEAKAMQASTLASLRDSLAAAVAAEAEAERLAGERAELERLRAEQARREAEEEATRRAAAQQAAAEHKLERDRLAAERRQLEADQAAARKEQKRLEDAARAEREDADRKARAERDEQDRIARAERAAEQKKLDDAAAALREEQAQAAAAQRQREDEAAAEQRRKQEAHAEEVRAETQARVDAEWKRASEAALSRQKLHDAAQSMLDALRQWKHAEDTKDKAELANARTSRDLAIAEAT